MFQSLHIYRGLYALLTLTKCSPKPDYVMYNSGDFQTSDLDISLSMHFDDCYEHSSKINMHEILTFTICRSTKYSLH